MKLRSLTDFRYGATGRLTPKQAKDNDLDPKLFTGGPVTQWKAGEVIEVDEALARRLMRDYGPDSKNRRFEALDPADERRLMSGKPGVPLSQVMERGYVTADEDAKPVNQDVAV